MDIKIIFWGTGKTAKRFIVNHPIFMKSVHVVGFTDTDSNKWNTFFGEYQVESPSTILNRNYDYIVVLSIYFKEIEDSLINLYQITLGQILSVDEAYELFLKKKYSSEIGNKFGSPQLLSELSYSERAYKRLLKEMNGLFAYLNLKEKYLPYIDGMEFAADEIICKPTVQKTEVPIWVCWLQGIENAPDIVKCCINSVRQNVKGKLHIISYENYSSYVNIQKDIIHKHEMGLISKTHFSDIIRLELLYRYGGIWIDATVLVMKDGLPDYVYELPLFMYKVGASIDEDYSDPRKFSSWFMATQKGNGLIGMTCKLINFYWKMELTYPYFLMHYLIRMVWDKYDNNDKNKLIFYSSNNYLLNNIINDTYDNALWTILKEEQPIQKLSYKQKFNNINTFYGYICETYLPA